MFLTQRDGLSGLINKNIVSSVLSFPADTVKT